MYNADEYSVRHVDRASVEHNTDREHDFDLVDIEKQPLSSLLLLLHILNRKPKL